jgi:hypothetical protein
MYPMALPILSSLPWRRLLPALTGTNNEDILQEKTAETTKRHKDERQKKRKLEELVEGWIPNGYWYL